MSVYKDTRSKFYRFDFSIESYRFSGSTKCVDKRDAETFEEARKVESRSFVDRLKAESREPMRFEAACRRWWSEHGSELADRKTEKLFDRIIELIGARKFLHEITDDDISRMVVERAKDTRRDSTTAKGDILTRRIKPATINRSIDLVRRVVRHARDNWNVAIMREPVWNRHRKAEARRHIREISPAEEAKLDEAESFDYAELRRFAIITGLRKRELLLRWPQVDFDLGTVSVITKGGVPRIIPLTEEAEAMLRRRRGHHGEYVFTYQAQRTWLGRHRKGIALPDLIRGQRYPITETAFASNKQRKWGAAGVDARIHDLRHTTGMRTLRSTGNLKITQKLLGHSDIATTATFYTDANVEDLRQAMEATAPRPVLAPKPVRKKIGKTAR